MARELTITVANPASVDELRPVIGGIPIAQGAAPKDVRFWLTRNGREALCQTQVLGTWPDGSARWLLLDFQADPPPRSSLSYKLV